MIAPHHEWGKRRGSDSMEAWTGAPKATAGDRARQAANLLGAIAQVATSTYVQSAGTDEFARPAPGGQPPLIPAGYAFAIWGPIFLGMLAYAIYQTLPSQRLRPVHRAIGWPTAIALFATASWVLVAQDDARIWLSVVVLGIIVAGLAIANRRLSAARATMTTRGERWTRRDDWLVRIPLAVFFGWVTAAVFANIAAALRESGMTAPGNETGITIALIAAALALAVAGLRFTRGSVWYAGTVAWALVAIAYANVRGEERTANLPVAVAAGAAILVVMVALWRVRRRPFAVGR